MRLSLRSFAAACVAAAVAFVPACSKSSTAPKPLAAGEKPKIGVVTNCVDPFWTLARAGAKKAETDFNCDVQFREPETADVATQMTIVEDLQRAGLNGLAVSVIKPADQAAPLKAVGASVPFITMDNDSPDSGRLCYIGVNNYEAGKAAGRLVKQAMPDGGTVALFIGNVSSANAQDRIGGVIDELAGKKDSPRTKGAKLGKYTLDDIHTDGDDRLVAADKPADAVQRLRGSGGLCLVGLYAYNTPAIVTAVKAKGAQSQVKIVGFDESEDTLKGIADGLVYGTVVQDPFQYGYLSVEVLAAVARGDKSKAVDKTIPARVVTKAGGPDDTAGGVPVKNVAVAAFEAKLKADLASGKGAK